MIRVTVPATSANVGVGYDVLGMAVSMYAHFDFERADALRITGCDEQWQNETNLVYIAFKKTLELLNKPVFPIALHMDVDIPPSRGLGSSSACVVAGIMGALALCEVELSKQELVDIATSIEGHPDNVAPALLGGLTCSFAKQSTNALGIIENTTIQSNVDTRMHFVACIPPYEVSTEEARKVVPQEIPLTKAIWNMGRMHAMVRALETADMQLLDEACNDMLHEPYRKELIPDYGALEALCAKHGATLWISGSGSTCMAALSNEARAQALAAAIIEQFPDMDVRALSADTHGAYITHI